MRGRNQEKISEDHRRGLCDGLRGNDPPEFVERLSPDYWRGYSIGQAKREAETAREFARRWGR
jgi:hypothetical protein